MSYFCEDIIDLPWKNLKTYDSIMKRFCLEGLMIDFYDRKYMIKKRYDLYKYLKYMENQNVSKTMYFTLINVIPEINIGNLSHLEKKYNTY